jgi:uncharacterized membrane protein YqjE
MAETHSGGLGESVRRLAVTLVAVIRTRLELLSNEAGEGALYAWKVFVLALAAMLCFGLAALAFTALVVAVFWDSHPLSVLAAIGCVYLILGMVAAFAIRRKMHTRPRLFSISLAELAKDRAQLEPAREQTQR